MDALSAQALNNLLPELAQMNAVARQFRLLLENSKQISLGGICVHAQKQVGRGQIKEAQGVRLHHLRQTKNAAQFVGGRRNADGQQGIAGFRGRDQVAYRTDAADARHERGHLGEGAAFTKFLESSKLRDVEASIFNAAIRVELQCDLAMPLDPRDRIDDNRFAHRTLHLVTLQNAFSCSTPAACRRSIPSGRTE